MNPATLRGSGRTTRMLRCAIEAAREGQAVYVIAAHHMSAARIRQMIYDLGVVEAEITLGIKVETPDSLGFDLTAMRPPPGAHSNCRWFVDHYAIEYQYVDMLRELHRYDP